MAASAIFHHAMAAGQAAVNPATSLSTAPSATSSTSGSSGSDDSATISANDFLTLLVTEMQNQDPTADTDPNEYINQLVQVNSLEQLIDINQTLSTDSSTPAATPSSSAANAAAAGSAAAGNSTNPAAGTPAAATTTPTAQAAPAAGSTTAKIMQAMHLGGGNSLGSLGAPGSPGIASAGSAHAPGAAAHVKGVLTQGNLGLQKINPAAKRVGHALAGRTHAAAGTAPPTAN